MKTKKLIYVLFLIATIICATSCDDVVKKNNYGNKTTTFVIDEISSINADNNMCTYLLKTTDTTDLNVSNTWIMDSIGKFKIGDTLIFKKVKNEN